jgi:hypothetical protein
MIFSLRRKEQKKLKQYYPTLMPAKDVLEAAINNPNPIVHPVATLFSATRIEHSKGEFYLYAEGMTPSVARSFESLNEERLSLCKTMGYRLYHWDNLDFKNYNLGETEEECRYRILNTSMDAAFGKDGMFSNKYLFYGVIASIAIHIVALYTFADKFFEFVPLTLNQWLLILPFSKKVLLVSHPHHISYRNCHHRQS